MAQIIVFGQGYETGIDTLTYNYRVGGNLDSIDLISGSNSATFPGGGWNTRSNILHPRFFFNTPGGQLFWSSSEFKPYSYSGLPHLGVAYMFGSNAQQYVRAEFQQMFRFNVMLNIDYQKNASNGILRNSVFNHETVQLKLRKRGELYSMDLKSSYESSKVEQSGGIISDSLPDYYSLGFIPVNRTESEVYTQRSMIELNQFIDFLKDSTKSAGICAQSNLRIKKYRLNESGLLNEFYPLINFDSLTTRDQHQWSQITGGAGFFYSGKNISTKIIPSFNYWNFQNLGRFNDTLEIIGDGELLYHRANLSFKLNGAYAFRGAQYEWNENFILRYQISGVDLSIKSTIQSQLPDYYQRYALGNNTLPVSAAWTRQNRYFHELGISRKWNVVTLDIRALYTQAIGNYWFIGSIWRNDTIKNLNFAQVSTNFAYRWKVLNCQLDYRYTKTRGIGNVIPEHQIFTRLYLKGGIFKARKMITYTGIEYGYLSSFNSIGYLPQVAALSLVPTGSKVPGQNFFHYYAGFKIDEFKFFVRLENLQSIWSVKTTQTLRGYPVAPLQIKVGITWDFFD